MWKLSLKDGREVIADTCTHCGSLQGNYYVQGELIDKVADGQDMRRQVDLALHTSLTPEDPREKPKSSEPFETEVMVAAGQIHHRDGNWENDDPQNLVLVCRNCHIKLHSQLGKRAKSIRSREQARRIKKEKAQAEKWRDNYYASRKKQQQKKSETRTKKL